MPTTGFPSGVAVTDEGAAVMPGPTCVAVLAEETEKTVRSEATTSRAVADEARPTIFLPASPGTSVQVLLAYEKSPDDVPVYRRPAKTARVRGTIEAFPTVCSVQDSGGRRFGLESDAAAMRFTVWPSEIHAQILPSWITAAVTDVRVPTGMDPNRE